MSGLLGDVLLGAIGGAATASLDELMRETERAEKEGLLKLEQEFRRQDTEYANKLALERAETERGWGQEDAATERGWKKEDLQEAADLEMDKYRKQKEVDKEFREPKEIPAEVQKLEYLKKEGLLEPYVRKEAGGEKGKLTDKQKADLLMDARERYDEAMMWWDTGEREGGLLGFGKKEADNPPPDFTEWLETSMPEVFSVLYGSTTDQSTAQPTGKKSLKPGDVVKGYVFKGGNPNDKANWEKK